MTAIQLYHKWNEKLGHIRVGENKARLRTFAWMRVGMITHLRHFRRLSRLTLLLALLYLWCIAFGTTIIKRGLRSLVDRSDRRDLSIFRIGLDMIERCLTNGSPFSIRFLPYFEKVYGS